MPVSEIDKYIAQAVKKKRNEFGYSMLTLSAMLDKSTSYVSHVEAHIDDKHYSTEVLNELAKIFKCSPRDFLPEQPL